MSDHENLPSIDALEDKIGSAKQTRELGASSGGSVSHGTRAGLDLVAGVTVGTVSGYFLDQWLNTLPLFMLTCMALGTAAGVKLMIETSNRASQKLEEEEKRNAQKEDSHGGR